MVGDDDVDDLLYVVTGDEVDGALPAPEAVRSVAARVDGFAELIVETFEGCSHDGGATFA